MLPSRLLCTASVFLVLAASSLAQPAVAVLSPAEAEAQKCEDRIASVRRDVFSKYDEQLNELLITMQKAADLEGALAVRAERQRLAMEQDLNDGVVVTDPKALHTLQAQTLTRLNDLTAQLINETVPRLVEFKKQLTIAGKLDDAVNVRSAIERLQNTHLSDAKADSSTAIPAETIVQAYAADRARADKIYKGQKITVHGVIGAYRPDPTDPKTYQVFISGPAATTWVQCNFPIQDFHFHEDKGSFGALTLVLSNRDNVVIGRFQKGQAVDIRGRCNGLDDAIHLDRCDQIK